MNQFKDIELSFTLTIDWFGYLKYILPFLLFGGIVSISLGLKAII